MSPTELSCLLLLEDSRLGVSPQLCTNNCRISRYRIPKKLFWDWFGPSRNCRSIAVVAEQSILVIPHGYRLRIHNGHIKRIDNAATNVVHTMQFNTRAEVSYKKITGDRRNNDDSSDLTVGIGSH